MTLADTASLLEGYARWTLDKRLDDVARQIGLAAS